MAVFLWLWARNETGRLPQENRWTWGQPKQHAGRARPNVYTQAAGSWLATIVRTLQQRRFQLSLNLRTMHNSLCTVQSTTEASHRARLDRRAAVQNHTREVAAPRFRACDITQCELHPLPGGCQPGSILGTSSLQHQTIASPRLNARRQCHRQASAVPSRRWARVGQGRRSTRK